MRVPVAVLQLGAGAKCAVYGLIGRVSSSFEALSFSTRARGDSELGQPLRKRLRSNLNCGIALRSRRLQRRVARKR